MAARKEEYLIKKFGSWKFVDRKSCGNEVLHMVAGNTKTGKQVICFNISPFYTCMHSCECFKEGLCYGNGGTYNFGSNLLQYTENYNFVMTHTVEEIAAEMLRQIATFPKTWKHLRFHTIGDFTKKTLEAAVIVARALPDFTIWAYTKKYNMVNSYVDTHGGNPWVAIPANFCILFSHWMNRDGSYYPMDNRYNFPTSEFIPIGKEELAEKVTHVCPCSDPTVLSTCLDCDKTCGKSCGKLTYGESMGLLEHSTTASAARDKEVKAAHNALKAAEKEKKSA